MATLTIEQKEANKLARKEAKEVAKLLAKKQAELDLIEQEKNSKVVKELTITIEWTKSRTWGNNPNASVKVSFMDGTFINKDGYKCSGCGYDKESTVIAEIFNDFLKYELWNRIETIKANKGERNVVPYGVGAWIENDLERGVNFDGGIGVSCYYRIAEFIGGKFENISSGKTFDVYKFSKTIKKAIIDEEFNGLSCVVDENRDIIADGFVSTILANRWANENGYTVVDEF